MTPPLAVFLWLLFALILGTAEEGFGSLPALLEYLFIIVLAMLFSYFYAGIPTIVYTLMMEWRFARGLNPASRQMVRYSTMLGGIIGSSFSIVSLFKEQSLHADFGDFATFLYGVSLITAPAGMAVGYIIGTLIRRGSTDSHESDAAEYGQVAATAGLFFGPVLAWVATRNAPPWVTMWAVAIVELYALKLLTLAGRWRTASAWRVVAYLLLWPGLDAEAFLGERKNGQLAGTTGELGWAALKFGFGLALFYWAAEHPASASAPWAGMVGIIFFLHFGLFHVLSWCWRKYGVDARPLMRSPILAVSVAEFWGERWNVAFAETARRYLLRPLARRWGVRWAGAFVFLVSGLVHETVISLPAGGGWGGPTGYFLLQAAGVGLEKSAAGRQLGLGAGGRGRAWMLLVTLAPLPLMLNAPFTERVFRPMLEAAGRYLS